MIQHLNARRTLDLGNSAVGRLCSGDLKNIAYLIIIEGIIHLKTDDFASDYILKNSGIDGSIVAEAIYKLCNDGHLGIIRSCDDLGDRNAAFGHFGDRIDEFNMLGHAGSIRNAELRAVIAGNDCNDINNIALDEVDLGELINIDAAFALGDGGISGIIDSSESYTLKLDALAHIGIGSSKKLCKGYRFKRQSVAR